MQDKVGLDVCIRAYQDDDYMGIMTMYDDFEPKGIAMGLPPPDDEVRRRWVDDIVRTFFNILALHQKKIIGHAAIDILRTKFSPEYMIFLHQDFRCRGIGTQVTLTVKEICRECPWSWSGFGGLKFGGKVIHRLPSITSDMNIAP